MNDDKLNKKVIPSENDKPIREAGVFEIEGHIRIYDPESEEEFVNKRNSIHFENFSEALASSVGNKSTGYVYDLHFGNGGTSIDSTGIITYLPANNTGQNADLYNQTYSKIVDNNSVLNIDPTRNKIEIRHTPGLIYSDLLVSVLLDFGEPAGQQAFDNSDNLDGTYVFDEIGLKTWEGTGVAGKLLTHVVFHPVQKSLNRLIKIDYTIRMQTLTDLTGT